MARTSITDNVEYPSFCYLAYRDEETFANFRMNPLYRFIVEGASYEQGISYLKVILNKYEFKITNKQWKNILINDTIGNPTIYAYEIPKGILNISPITLRYTKVYCDIVNLFPESILQGGVCEIGIGYGAQCRILMNMLPILYYNLVDLPEVILLAEKFLTRLGQKGDIRYIDGTHLYNDLPCDLVISNYAFSELTKSIQEFYIDRIISKSKAGYMTWNYSAMVSGGWKEGHELEEILSMIPGSRVIPEEPLIAPGNCIIVWGTK